MLQPRALQKIEQPFHVPKNLSSFIVHLKEPRISHTRLFSPWFRVLYHDPNRASTVYCELAH